MIQDLRKRMEVWIKKIQEKFNKDLEELKNKQTVNILSLINYYRILWRVPWAI